MLSGAAFGLALAALSGSLPAAAQSAPSTPRSTAQTAAEKAAGYAAAQQLLPPLSAASEPTSGITTTGGAVIAPADIAGRMPAGASAPPSDGILRSAPPASGVDASGRAAVVSGATIH
jgi:hypothetical protein